MFDRAAARKLKTGTLAIPLLNLLQELRQRIALDLQDRRLKQL
jgi:hypothetical protein